MSNTLRFVFLLFFLFVGGKTMAQITTSGIRGLVADEQSEPVVGATVLATHIPSGTRYGGVTAVTTSGGCVQVDRTEL